ncbi:MAG TPA: WhiB family transcriptional regulator [Acidimicrobiia bacterium]
MSDADWMTDAACRDVKSTMWDDNVPTPSATRYCFRCPVQRDCLGYGIRRPYTADAGVLGGLGLYDRQQIRAGKSTVARMWKMRLEELVAADWDAALDEQMIREAACAA